jgi:hypothetical protein
MMSMMRSVLFVALFGLLASFAVAADRAPVLVELFTSEGCSSCPPADRVLESLDASAIVLSEHVDYWDNLGWRDPYSSRANTQRQEAYARHFSAEGPYTPQMVVDGTVQFNGSDAQRAGAEIARSAAKDKTAIRLSLADGQLKIETGTAGHSADVMLAIAEDRGASQVAAGENRGRTLHHVAMLRSLRKVGSIKRGEQFSKTIDLGKNAAGKRVVVFLQDSDLGRVSGAGSVVP